MTTPLAARAAALTPSATLAIGRQARELKAKGVDVVAFGAGEPDFPVPAPVRAACERAIRDGQNRYTDAAGIPELRAAIAQKLAHENGVEFAPDQILVSTGAKQSLYLMAQALCDAGTEAIVPAPYWVSYPDMVRLAGATPVVVEQPAPRFVLEPDRLRAALTPRTRLLFLNSPSNPTGATYGEGDLAAVAEALADHACVVVTDEIYEKLVYDGARHVSFARAAPALRDRTVVVNGFSKAFAMTGWRLGYAAGPRDVITAATRIQEHCTSNATSIVQHAALACLQLTDADLAPMVTEFDRRRRFMVDRLSAMPGVRCPTPTGAFYCFPDVSGCYGRTVDGHAVADSQSFSAALLAVASVAVVPGGAFGADRHVRLSYATSMEQIEKGLARMQAFCERLRG